MSATTAVPQPAPAEKISIAERFSAAVYDPALALGERRGMARRRRELLAEASGRVLEIGAGTGLNVEHYPSGLREVVLAEPVAAMAKRAERRRRDAVLAGRVVLAPAEALPFEDDSFDTVVSTMVLCTVEDPARAIAEIRRVLRPSGKLLFIEHLRADTKWLARFQDLLYQPWRVYAEGCRCNQPTLDLLADNGLAADEVKRDRWRGMPRLVAPLAIGSATA